MGRAALRALGVHGHPPVQVASWLFFFLLVMHCSLASFFAFIMSFAYAAASASDGMCFLLLGIILVCVFSGAKALLLSLV